MEVLGGLFEESMNNLVLAVEALAVRKLFDQKRRLDFQILKNFLTWTSLSLTCVQGKS